MKPDHLSGADVLLVRSVTNVNRDLLSQSRVKYVGTCTIGTDHLDKSYLDRAGIAWSAAPGCNAGGVVQYALAAMANYAPDWSKQTIGIVGCGNVGGRLYRTLKALGVRVKVNDPFKSQETIPELTSLEEVLCADIICLHTPLTTDGPHPTFRLLGRNELANVNPNGLLISAGRGEVIDNFALFDHLQTRPSLNVVLDVWQGEPDIYTPLVDLIRCGTPHIAGYSFEGKLNGSLMIFEALSKWLKEPSTKISSKVNSTKETILGNRQALEAPTINEAILKTYPIQADDKLIRDSVNRGESMSLTFDLLRKGYWQRREFSHFYCPQAQGDIHEFLSIVNSVE
jgi:erythronate-4-phosphate dehydrogenase